MIDSKNKPESFLKMYPKGSCPVVRVGERVIGDSKSIVTYADKKLRGEGAASILPSLDKAKNLGSSNLVGTIWNLCSAHFKAKKSGGSDGAAEEEKKAEEEREKLEGLLEALCVWLKERGPLLQGGSAVTTADLTLYPALLHTMAIAQEFLGWNILNGRPALATFKEEMEKRSSVRSTAYTRAALFNQWIPCEPIVRARRSVAAGVKREHVSVERMSSAAAARGGGVLSFLLSCSALPCPALLRTALLCSTARDGWSLAYTKGGGEQGGRGFV